MLGSSKITLFLLFSDKDQSCPLPGMVRTHLFIPTCICPSTLRAWSLEWVRLLHSQANFLTYQRAQPCLVLICAPRKCKAALLCPLIYTEGKPLPHIMERLQESQESLCIIATILTPERVEWIQSSTQCTITTTSNNSVCYSRKPLLNKSALQWHLLGDSGIGRQNRPNIRY